MDTCRGATNDIIARADLDRMYDNESGELKILDGYLSATKSITDSAELLFKLSNYSKKPITIISDWIEIYEDYQLLTSHRLCGTKKDLQYTDYQLKLSANDEVVEYFHFGFTASQCFLLGINRDGITDKKLNYKVIFECAEGIEYVAIHSNGLKLVKGDFL
ncbi:hypothetical protein [Psychrobacillus sp. L4]|uniref:hypothetical protein n=1 Tax=Psychrobacillus sp. L4 TaxID=3236892 RepID=UPI0036F2AD09